MAIAIILLALIVGAFLIGLLFKILKKSMKLGFKLLIHACFGFVFLFIFNFFGAWVDLSIPLTWLNAIVSGVLGVPGVILLLILQLI